MTFIEKSLDVSLATLIGVALPALFVFGPSILTR